MSAAKDLINEMLDLGIVLVIDHGRILCRSKERLSRELVIRVRTHKAEIISLLEHQNRRHGNPRLVNGELRVQGLLPPGTILDTLLELNAPDDVVERYLDPIGTHKSWARWEEIKRNRT
jgi:hypothetical protein